MDSCKEIFAIRPTYHYMNLSYEFPDSPSSTLLLILQYQPYLVHFTLDFGAAEAVPGNLEHSRSVSHLLCVCGRSPPALQRLDCVAAEAVPGHLEHSRSVSHLLCVRGRSPLALQRSRLRFHRWSVVVVSLSLLYHQSRYYLCYYLLSSSAQILRRCLFFSARQPFVNDLFAAAVFQDQVLDRHPVEAS